MFLLHGIKKKIRKKRKNPCITSVFCFFVFFFPLLDCREAGISEMGAILNDSICTHRSGKEASRSPAAQSSLRVPEIEDGAHVYRQIAYLKE